MILFGVRKYTRKLDSYTKSRNIHVRAQNNFYFKHQKMWARVKNAHIDTSCDPTCIMFFVKKYMTIFCSWTKCIILYVRAKNKSYFKHLKNVGLDKECLHWQIQRTDMFLEWFCSVKENMWENGVRAQILSIFMFLHKTMLF